MCYWEPTCGYDTRFVRELCLSMFCNNGWVGWLIGGRTFHKGHPQGIKNNHETHVIAVCNLL